jgi:hypothetical protein
LSVPVFFQRRLTTIEEAFFAALGKRSTEIKKDGYDAKCGIKFHLECNK